MQTTPLRQAPWPGPDGPPSGGRQDRPLRQIVRPMALEDLAQVMEVEQQSFPTMWPPTAFMREIQQNQLARYLVAMQRRADPAGGDDPAPSPGRAAGLGRFLGDLRQFLHGDGTLPPPEERQELVVGFVGIWMLADEAHIVTIAVRDSHRGRGIGELLLIAAIQTVLRERQSVVTLECRVSNGVALRLYQKYGFRQVGRRTRYYSDNREDAYIVTVAGIDTLAYRRLFEQRRNEHRERCGDYQLSL